MANGLLGSRPVRVAVLALVASGCGYKPGAFTGPAEPFTGRPSTVGCLDLAVTRKPDSKVGPVLAFDFGNRCLTPAVVDFQHARVEGVTVHGQRIALAPYDPQFEIALARVDARGLGHEAIAYAATEPLTQLCIDEATIAHVAGAAWQCFVEAP